MGGKKGWIAAAVALVLVAVCLIPYGVSDYVAGLMDMFIPWWVQALLAAALVGLVGWRLRRRAQLLRRGATLLAAGVMVGVYLPWLGAHEQVAINITRMITSTPEFYPTFDPARLRLECAFVPFSGAGIGVTAIFHNPGGQPVEYVAALPPFHRYVQIANQIEYWNKLGQFNDHFIPIRLAPGETRRVFWPLGLNMLGPLMYVEAYNGGDPGMRDRPLLAICGMLSGSRRGLLVLGALLALTGLACLGVSAARREGAGIPPAPGDQI